MSNEVSREDAMVIKHLREMNDTLSFCGPAARYDLQRNFLDLLRDLTNGFTETPEGYETVMDEIVSTISSTCDGGMGKVMIALRCARDGSAVSESEAQALIHENVISFTSLKENFEAQAEGDSFVVDCPMAELSSDNVVTLSPWGQFVLERLELWQRTAQADISSHPHFNQIEKSADLSL